MQTRSKKSINYNWIAQVALITQSPYSQSINIK